MRGLPSLKYMAQVMYGGEAPSERLPSGMHTEGARKPQDGSRSWEVGILVRSEARPPIVQINNVDCPIKTTNPREHYHPGICSFGDTRGTVMVTGSRS